VEEWPWWRGGVRGRRGGGVRKNDPINRGYG